MTPRLKPVLWIAVIGIVGIVALKHPSDVTGAAPKAAAPTVSGSASTALSHLTVRADTSISGYSRAQFGKAWADVDGNSCDTRDDVLARDLHNAVKTGSCTVVSGTLPDPYTGHGLAFLRGPGDKVQIDHVVPLGNAWVTGARTWTAAKREQLANDPLNLLAVDAHNNEQKGDKDASEWVPPAKSFDCVYISRQITVKTKYRLTVAPAEKQAMMAILHTCPGQGLVTK